MARTIRFHLDENCPRSLAEGLRRRGIDVSTTPDAGLLAATDEEQLAFSRDAGRILVTQDRDFLHLHAAGATHIGIVFFEKNAKSVGEMLSGLILIWELCEPDELSGHVEFP